MLFSSVEGSYVVVKGSSGFVLLEGGGVFARQSNDASGTVLDVEEKIFWGAIGICRGLAEVIDSVGGVAMRWLEIFYGGRNCFAAMW